MSQSLKVPTGGQSIDQILEEARTHIQRLAAAALLTELGISKPAWGPTHIIDIRPAQQRKLEGPIRLPWVPAHLIDNRPAAQRALEGSIRFPAHTFISRQGQDRPAHEVHIIERNVLEWRLDPQCESRIEEIVGEYGYATRIVVVCSEGYASSLAARDLQRLGLKNATDLEGGIWALKSEMDGDGFREIYRFDDLS